MSCYHPLTGMRSLTPNPETGKYPVRIIKTEYRPELAVEYGDAYIPIPCGKCIGCRLDYSRQWADRCLVEASYHVDNIFLTLTYSPEHLPPCREGSKIHSLSKRDLQLFMKRLRKSFPDIKIRFYACGEYGPTTMRPHFHLILFGFKPDDAKFLKRKNGFDYFTSDNLARIWPFGFHTFTDVSWDTCAYVARYVMKKQKGLGSSIYEDLNYEPEFTLMSRRPGIGRQFYDDHNDIVVNPQYLPTKDGHKTIRSNRYYDKCFDVEYPNDLEFIKQDRSYSALQSVYLKTLETSMSPTELRHSEEINKQAQIRCLTRKEV